MENFDELIQTVEKLISPEGCQWDREQTLESLRPYLIEEVYEIIEAIDLNDNALISEEVGDVFFHLVFICKLAERDGRFNVEQALKMITEKLIRRHPHVFEDIKLDSMDEILAQWDAIKKLEKGKSSRKSLLDDIPKDLPTLAKAQKMVGKFCKVGFDLVDRNEKEIPDFEDEDQLGSVLYSIVEKAHRQGLNAKLALLKKINQLEKEFRAWEQESSRKKSDFY